MGRVSAIRHLLAALDQAASIYEADRIQSRANPGRNVGPPKLHAAKRIILAFVEFLMAVDLGEPGVAQRRRQPALDLLKALDDLQQGREAPEWIKAHKLAYRGPSSVAEWGARATAAGVLQRLIDAKVPKAQAQNDVWRVVTSHGLKAPKAATVYGWLRQCREASTERELDHRSRTFRNFLDHFPYRTDVTPDQARMLLLDFLQEELLRMGFPLRKSGR